MAGPASAPSTGPFRSFLPRDTRGNSDPAPRSSRDLAGPSERRPVALTSIQLGNVWRYRWQPAGEAGSGPKTSRHAVKVFSGIRRTAGAWHSLAAGCQVGIDVAGRIGGPSGAAALATQRQYSLSTDQLQAGEHRFAVANNDAALSFSCCSRAGSPIVMVRMTCWH